MKPTVLFAATAAILAAVGLAYWAKHQPAPSRGETAVRVTSTSEHSSPGDPQSTRLAEENSRLRQQLADMQLDLASTQAGSNRMLLAQQAAKNNTGQKSAAKGMGGLLKEMMDDPEMRKGMMQQQKMAMDMVYGPMIKDLGLSSEEADKFKELLISKQMDAMSLVGDAKAGDITAANQTKIADLQKENEAKIKEILGDKRYAEYTEYNQTLGERMALNQFAAQTPSVTSDQKDQILAIIKEEKKRAPEPGAPAADPSVQGINAMQSDEAMEKLLQQQSELNARVLERSRGVLSQEQSDQLASFQTGQISMQRVGIQMARKMMGGDNAAPPAAPAAPQPQ